MKHFVGIVVYIALVIPTAKLYMDGGIPLWACVLAGYGILQLSISVQDVFDKPKIIISSRG